MSDGKKFLTNNLLAARNYYIMVDVRTIPTVWHLSLEVNRVSKSFRIIGLVLALVFLFVAAGCSNSQEQSSSQPEKTEQEKIEDNFMITEDMFELVMFEDIPENAQVAVMETSMGTIKILLFPEQAPKAVENFVKHAQEGYYNGLRFTSVINDYMIQTGDPEDGTGGQSVFTDEEGNVVPFEDEPSLDLWHFRGAVSMVANGPNSNGSQFCIIQNQELDSTYVNEMSRVGFPVSVIEKYEELGGAPWLDQKRTVFGSVIEGMEVVDEIAQVETEDNVPVEDVIVTSITIETYNG